jgi:protein SCO1/2
MTNDRSRGSACSVALSVALALAAASSSLGCSKARPNMDHATGLMTASGSGSHRAPTSSIYALNVELHDFAATKIGVDVFRGHPVLVTMFYGSCPSACPLLVHHVKEIESSLTPEIRADLRVLLVSFDADHDTPAVLRELAGTHHVDVTRWRFASGTEDAARQLANVLGITYRKEDEGFFSHNSVISVLDRDGRIVVRSEAPREELALLATAVSEVGR